ncbi:MAG: hypothetical protein HRU75_11600 [Planctomycetia bacterium]|nr:MAG: hypothetical protein HRU75_11600 [Planctomycetia bacterium]
MTVRKLSVSQRPPWHGPRRWQTGGSSGSCRDYLGFLRSRRSLDVAAIARQFGGGGHVRAAGARQPGDWKEVTERVIAAVSAGLKGG